MVFVVSFSSCLDIVAIEVVQQQRGGAAMCIRVCVGVCVHV